MWVARKRGVQALLVECLVQGCGLQWRHDMRRHFQQHHSDIQVTDERTAQWDSGPEEIIVLREGRGALFGTIRGNQQLKHHPRNTLEDPISFQPRVR